MIASARSASAFKTGQSGTWASHSIKVGTGPIKSTARR